MASTKTSQKVRDAGGAAKASVMVRRVADYLPMRVATPTDYKRVKDSYPAAFLSAWTGGFLVLADTSIKEEAAKGVIQGAKENVTNEAVNMGLISALMLTMIVPMAFDNVNDWLEEDYEGSGFIFLDGWLGQRFGETAVEDLAPTLNDFVMIFYLISFAGYLFSTILTVIILLCVGEVQTDVGVYLFLKDIGCLSRAPYLFFLLGCVFAFPAAIRFFATVKTIGGFIVISLAHLFLAGFMIYLSPRLVQGTIRAHNSTHEYQDLQLSRTQVQEDVETWFAQNPQGDTLQTCLQDMSGIVSDRRDFDVILPLDSISQQRVAFEFHKRQSENIGIILSQSDLYRLCVERG